MNSNLGSNPLSAGTQTVKKAPLKRPGNYFFVTLSLAFFIIAAIGFIPGYQTLEQRLFPHHWFAHVHGIIMATWLLVFVSQSILVAKGNLMLHRQLGQMAAVLGVLVWVSMGLISFLTLLADNPPVDHFLFDVLILQLYGMILFGLFFTWGLVQRKNAATHKRLLFLATLVLIQAAIDRMHWLPWLHDGLENRFFYLDAFLMPLFIYDLVTQKKIYYITWIGSLTIAMTQYMTLLIWGSPQWHQFWFELLQAARQS